jgi:uncharacterized protein involved in exopolysaccharide biosynthesis
VNTSILLADIPVVKAVRSAKRRWKPAILVSIGMMTITLLVAFLMPRKYLSHLKILVKNERANSLINVGERTQGVVYINDVSEAQISTEIELLTSGDLLRDVVARCGLAELVSKKVTDPEKRVEIAINDLRKSLTVAAEHRSNVIGITYASRDPKLSARVLQAISDIYLNSHLLLHGAPGSYEFFNGMWEDASSQLNKADNELANLRATQHIVSLQEDKNVLLQHVSDLQIRLAESRAAAQKNQREAVVYKDSIAHMNPSVERERRSIPNQTAIEQLSTLLVTLQNKRAELTTRYQPEDRLVKELDAQIIQTQEAIEKARNSPSQEIASGTNPTFQNTEENYVHANATYLGSIAEATSLNAAISSERARLAEMNSITAQYDDLVRKRDELARLRENYRKGRDEAYVDESLDKKKLSNVAIVESPVPERLSVLPHRGMILGVGFIWSLLAGLLTAFALEFSRPRVYSSLELEQTVSVPLLAAVPQNAPLSLITQEFPELYLAMQRKIFAPQGQPEA